MFIDIHSHLDMCKDVSKIIENAKKSNVLILTCGVNVKSNRETLKLKNKFPEIKICLGGYPSDILKLSEKELNEEIKFIESNKKEISAISEVGLDLKENNLESLEKQKENLGKFVLLSKKLNIPIIVHSRKVEKETIEFLESFNYKKIIMHCFSGNMKLIERIVKDNWYLSIPGNVKSSEHFQNMIKIVPIENLFCETDSPYLHPDKIPNNEPANVIESYKKISEIKKISLKETEKQIEKNYNNLFE